MKSLDSSSEIIQKNNTIVARIVGKDNDEKEIDWDIVLTHNVLSDDFKSIINTCVDPEAENRPTAELLYNIACAKMQDMEDNLETTTFDTFLGKSLQ